uniref:C2H2-type domain-containing protein n=1 Tax=Trichobilharzia regenti TaxID=157069 RepID=A0AA85KI71_TRIRE|nr:unnamed protein product [Trichobilharzia regenti]
MMGEALDKFAADPTGLVDYALESGGGSLMGVRNTGTYTEHASVLSIYGYLLLYISKSPRTILHPGNNPVDCWTFHGSEGQAIIRLSFVTSVTLKHLLKTLAPNGKLDSAPKGFLTKKVLETSGKYFGCLVDLDTYECYQTLWSSRTTESRVTLKNHILGFGNLNSEPTFVWEICLGDLEVIFNTLVVFIIFILSAHLYVESKIVVEPSYPIDGCSYVARTAGRLAQHKIIHGQGRRFSCDYCEYSATTSSNLRRHARIHAGARPYLCPHCTHRTSELDALKKHVLDSGRHPGLPLYVCLWCRLECSTVCVGFNSSNLAWRHLLNEHSPEITKLQTFSRIGRLSEKLLSEE